MSRELLLFVTRPDGTPLWLPGLLAEHLGLSRRDRMTAAQFANEEVQSLLKRRLAAQQK